MAIDAPSGACGNPCCGGGCEQCVSCHCWGHSLDTAGRCPDCTVVQSDINVLFWRLVAACRLQSGRPITTSEPLRLGDLDEPLYERWSSWAQKRRGYSPRY